MQSCLSGQGGMHGRLLLPQTPQQFDSADLLPMTFDREVSSLGGSSVCLCWMGTDAYASEVEGLINSPVTRHQTTTRGFLKTAPTCSAAHGSSPPWLKLTIARLKKPLHFQMHLPASSEKKYSDEYLNSHQGRGGYIGRV